MATPLIARLRRGGDDAGAELIELAIVLPLLLFVIAGIMDFGFLFQRYEVVTNAAREGARIAVLPGYAESDVQARVQNYLTVSGLTDTATTAVTAGTETLPGGMTVTTTAVDVQYPASFFFLGPLAGLVGGDEFDTVTLHANSVMRVETAGGS
jgi:Flp pilus assembly protein TadG